MAESSDRNGTDLGHVVAMLHGVVNGMEQLRAEMRAEFRDVRAEIRDVRAEIRDVRAEVASLSQAVTQYHAAVTDHGMLITELDTRVRRIEQHLDLPPAA